MTRMEFPREAVPGSLAPKKMTKRIARPDSKLKLPRITAIVDYLRVTNNIDIHHVTEHSTRIERIYCSGLGLF